MVHIKNNQRKNLAMSLRRGGYSYSEIQKFVTVSKSTLNFWFQDLKLSEPQLERLRKKRSEAVKLGTKNRALEVERAVERIRDSAAKDIGTISKRELWLMGVMLYWRERMSERDVRNGVHFTSSDPMLIQFIVYWLREVGKLTNSDLIFDIFIPEKGEDAKNKNTNLLQKNFYQKNIVEFWQKVINTDDFNPHVYVQKGRSKRRVKREAQKSEVGFLRIRVRASSMLARQLVGWIKGIQNINKL